MKVILLQDVAKIGRRFDVVEVPSGYGMNKLIPQGMAKPATPENIKAINAQSAKNEADRTAGDEAFAAVIAAVKEVSLQTVVEANEEGRMFQALKVGAVIDAIQEQTGSTINESQVVIKAPIKEIGEHTIELVSGDTTVPISITVVVK